MRSTARLLLGAPTALLVLSLLLSACGDDDGGGDAGPDGGDGGADAGRDASLPGNFGQTCRTSADCAGGPCVDVGGGRMACSTDCAADAECLGGWTCASDQCACAAAAETCDGTDEDCDGQVDEGRGEEVGCGIGQICRDSSCECETQNMCGGECVDRFTDRNHCGACDHRCDVDEACFGGACCLAEKLDLDVLFVVDDSGSMQEEQESLAAQLPRMIEVLITGDIDDDGEADFPPAGSLHLGVVGTSMGTGGFEIAPDITGCVNPMFGDDGILRHTGNPAVTGCDGTFPSFLDFDPAGSATSAEVAADFACIAQLGTRGCGFEQQLEASLKALTPSTSDLRFLADSVGHGDGENDGFLRPDSVLAVVVVSDENDCSAADPELFNLTSTTYPGDVNLRCYEYQDEALHPTSRYVDGLRALRADHPDRLIFAAIAGVPTDLVADPDAIDYDAILADDRMTEQVAAGGGRLEFSCEAAGRGAAFPPRRIVEVARDLAPGSTVQSICQEDFGPAMIAIVERISVPLAEACLL